MCMFASVGENTRSGREERGAGVVEVNEREILGTGGSARYKTRDS